MNAKDMANWIAFLFDHIIEKYGGETTLNEFRVMQEITRRSLYGQSTTLTEIYNVTGVKKATVSRVVSRLRERGYVFEEIDRHDRRVRQIHVTESFQVEVIKHFDKLRRELPGES